MSLQSELSPESIKEYRPISTSPELTPASIHHIISKAYPSHAISIISDNTNSVLKANTATWIDYMGKEYILRDISYYMYNLCYNLCGRKPKIFCKVCNTACYCNERCRQQHLQHHNKKCKNYKSSIGKMIISPIDDLEKKINVSKFFFCGWEDHELDPIGKKTPTQNN